MMAIGAFIDAENQLETQRLFQQLTAKAHKDYTASVGLCEIGTALRSLSATERRGEFNADVMSRRMQDRQLNNKNSIASDGEASDTHSRIDQFIDTYCDPHDNDESPKRQDDGLEMMCKSGGGKPERINKDIDFTRTMYLPLTLDLRFDDGQLQDDEEDVMALANNLYANNVMSPVGSQNTAVPDNYTTSPDVQTNNDPGVILDVRAVTAKRSVAQNTFNALAAMKSASAIDTAANPYDYLASIMKQLGIDKDDDIKTLLGEQPSYYAQMEVLTKKIYQRPEFYTNLYDKPANVERMSAAMRAIELMQDMDMFDSHLRSEASLSVLLEMKIRQLQKDYQNKQGTMEGTGEKK